MTTTRVRLYDIDTGAYDVSPDGNSVDIYGAAYFAGAALDPVSFRLILTRADSEDPEGAAMIVFNDEELAAAGLGLANDTAEAALLDALRTPGLNDAGAPAVLTRCLIDNYLEPEKAGAGSSECLITASGYQVAVAPLIPIAQTSMYSTMTPTICRRPWPPTARTGQPPKISYTDTCRTRC